MTEATLASIPTAAEPTAAEPGVKKDRLKKKKDRVRSAWISFVGRILAQVIGAAATITLGLMFVQKHQSYQAALERDKNKATVSAPGEIVLSDHSVAVLPMQNFSGDRNEDYFADGMTEALIASLAQVPSLRVISRTSSMAYKQTQRPLREIAGELGVRWIVEGSVVRREGRVRVTAQLIDARTDEHLWARIYDRAQSDVLAIQADVAAAIARDVRGALSNGGDE
jgi:TolB-like protein